MYLGMVFLPFILFMHTKWGRWSDICVTMMPAGLVLEVCDSLHRTLSKSVPFKSENLVGRVIFGGNPCVIIESK